MGDEGSPAPLSGAHCHTQDLGHVWGCWLIVTGCRCCRHVMGGVRSIQEGPRVLPAEVGVHVGNKCGHCCVSSAQNRSQYKRCSVNVERAGSGTYTALGKYSYVISDGFVEFPSLRLSEWPLPVSWVVWSSGQVLDRSGLGSAAGAVCLWASSLASLRFSSLSHWVESNLLFFLICQIMG